MYKYETPSERKENYLQLLHIKLIFSLATWSKLHSSLPRNRTKINFIDIQ